MDRLCTWLLWRICDFRHFRSFCGNFSVRSASFFIISHAAWILSFRNCACIMACALRRSRYVRNCVSLYKNMVTVGSRVLCMLAYWAFRIEMIFFTSAKINGQWDTLTARTLAIYSMWLIQKQAHHIHGRAICQLSYAITKAQILVSWQLPMWAVKKNDVLI